MRLSILLPALLSATASCLPALPEAMQVDPHPVRTVGRACTGENMSGNCTQLVETQPNKCMKSINGNFPFRRSTRSLNLTSAVNCAFFQVEACIHPNGSLPAMLFAGPAPMPFLNSNLHYGIAAYLCGDAATRMWFPGGNATVPPGTVIIRNQDEGGDGGRDGEQDKEVEVEVRTDGTDSRAATLYKSTTFSSPPSEQLPIPIPSSSSPPFCTDLSNVYGNFEGQVRGVAVEAGFRCTFYTEKKCATTGFSWTLGKETERVEMRDSPKVCEGIRSVVCVGWK
ncbi:hypothetical protein K491DRAFT_779186 [Lophiostoma macrostomum CBS 122681]|uniref:Ubiquitin 3 binding protein But2 C-terminal domain-containing protein n=1 Tax=Lophiostoma macrostomum CBS 122681 TaxID=1314788 RepID=A0A6A6T4R6_9PLEO|nr:hypothetical protein K491DRAFT_779186 [Lophiostoma macrostomum CBS 122681]